jgi:sulfur carrier protein ThiS
MQARRKTFLVKSRGKVYDILVKSKMNPEVFLIFIGSKPIPDDFVAKKGDRLELVEITTSG